MEAYRKKRTEKQKLIFTIISRGFVTPVQSLTVKAFFKENLVTILKALLAMNDGSCLSSVKTLYALSSV